MSTRKSVNGQEFFTIAWVFRITIFTLFCCKLIKTENVFPAGVSVIDNCLILFVATFLPRLSCLAAGIRSANRAKHDLTFQTQPVSVQYPVSMELQSVSIRSRF